MTINTKLTPFTEAVAFTLLNAACEAQPVADLDDVQILFTVNGVFACRFKQDAEAATDEEAAWYSWQATDTENVIECELTNALTLGWRGLVETEVRQVLDGNTLAPERITQFMAVKSSFTD